MKEKLKDRTKLFALDIITLCENMPKATGAYIITNQIMRSATSVGANYRAVCRARSDREFVAKMNIVLEEADECCFWLELIQEKKWIDIKNLWTEANELTAIFVSSLKTVNSRIKSK